MAGEITVRVGQYDITQGVWFDLRTTDAGVILALTDSRVNRRYTIRFDAAGAVNYKQITTMDGDLIVTAPAEAPGLINPGWTVLLTSGRAKAPVSRRTGRTPSNIKLTITTDKKTYRKRNRASVFGGYRCESAVILLCRTRGVGGKVKDCLIRIVRKLCILEDGLPDEVKLSNEDWDRFLDLPANAVIKIGGKEWAKLDMPALREFNEIVLLSISRNDLDKG